MDSLNETKTLAKHVKDLESIKKDSVDEILVKGLQYAIKELRKEHARPGGKSVLFTIEMIHPNLSSPSRSLLNSCKKLIPKNKPEWQIIAEREGWTPSSK
ncbi:MAG: hypothetical protein HRT73_12145 [Flavobacteriales bacterium]|nr:hypothetical protein [Flavobacteriales bacterium]